MGNLKCCDYLEVKVDEHCSNQILLKELPQVYSIIDAMAKELDNANAVVYYALTCKSDMEGKRYLSGTITTEIKLQCTRCMSAISYPLLVEVCLYVQEDDGVAAKDVDSANVDLIFMHQGKVNVPELLESELILALPEFIKHDETDAGCISYKDKFLAKDDKPENSAKIGRTNPFSQLVDYM